MSERWTVETDFGVNGDGARFVCDPCFNAAQIAAALNAFTEEDVQRLKMHLDDLEMDGSPTTEGVERQRAWLRRFVERIALLASTEPPK